MSLAFPEVLTLYIRTPQMSAGEPVRDNYGVVQYQETTRGITGASVWPLGNQRALLSSGEDATDQYTRTYTTYSAVIPPDISVAAIDRAEWRGQTWEVQGEPDQYSSPFTGAALQTIRLNRVEG
jgi:hypothetical protein